MGVTVLDRRDRMILGAIARAWRDDGCAPTVRELGAAAGISSTSVVAYHLEKLRMMGLVRWRPGKYRTLRIVGDGARWEAM